MSAPICHAEVWPVGFDGPHPAYEVAVRSVERGLLWRSTVIIPMSEADHLENVVVGKLGNLGYNAMERMRRVGGSYFITVFDVNKLREDIDGGTDNG